MLDNENITSTSGSEAVQKIPAEEKGYGIMVLYVFYFAEPQHTKSRPTYASCKWLFTCLLGYIQCS